MAEKKQDDIIDDSELRKPMFSPVCTWCRFWHPDKPGNHCAGAYPVGGPEIPEKIWSGAAYHLTPYPNAAHPTDHGVLFELHPDAEDAMKKQNPGLAKAWAAREAKRAETGEKPTAPKAE